jgi:hypothetical protein
MFSAHVQFLPITFSCPTECGIFFLQKMQMSSKKCKRNQQWQYPHSRPTVILNSPVSCCSYNIVTVWENPKSNLIVSAKLKETHLINLIEELQVGGLLLQCRTDNLILAVRGRGSGWQPVKPGISDVVREAGTHPHATHIPHHFPVLDVRYFPNAMLGSCRQMLHDDVSLTFTVSSSA